MKTNYLFENSKVKVLLKKRVKNIVTNGKKYSCEHKIFSTHC